MALDQVGSERLLAVTLNQTEETEAAEIFIHHLFSRFAPVQLRFRARPQATAGRRCAILLSTFNNQKEY